MQHCPACASCMWCGGDRWEASSPAIVRSLGLEDCLVVTCAQSHPKGIPNMDAMDFICVVWWHVPVFSAVGDLLTQVHRRLVSLLACAVSCLDLGSWSRARPGGTASSMFAGGAVSHEWGTSSRTSVAPVGLRGNFDSDLREEFWDGGPGFSAAVAAQLIRYGISLLQPCTVSFS